MALPVSEAPGVARPRRLLRIVRSFGYAVEGLAAILRTQPNFWVHLTAAVVALGLGILLRLSAVELALIVFSVALVMVVEALNTALETLCDLASPDHHPLIKRVKDVAAAAVLIAALGAVVIAVLLFGPRLVRLLLDLS